jgi:hypothetical protein
MAWSTAARSASEAVTPATTIVCSRTESGLAAEALKQREQRGGEGDPARLPERRRGGEVVVEAVGAVERDGARVHVLTGRGVGERARDHRAPALEAQRERRGLRARRERRARLRCADGGVGVVAVPRESDGAHERVARDREQELDPR